MKEIILVYLIKDDEFGVVKASTNMQLTAEILAEAHNKAVANGATPNEEFADSLSGYHCSMWSADGDCIAVYGEEGTVLCEPRELDAEEISEDMFRVYVFATNGIVEG